MKTFTLSSSAATGISLESTLQSSTKMSTRRISTDQRSQHRKGHSSTAILESMGSTSGDNLRSTKTLCLEIVRAAFLNDDGGHRSMTNRKSPIDIVTIKTSVTVVYNLQQAPSEAVELLLLVAPRRAARSSAAVPVCNRGAWTTLFSIIRLKIQTSLKPTDFSSSEAAGDVLYIVGA